jgi:glutathione S-transferase
MLEELGLGYDHIQTNFTTDVKKPDYLALNPNGHIPTLVDGDTVIWESMAINLYLARKYDQGLWPTTLEDEGRAFQWSFWAMTEVEEPLLTALMHRMFLPENERDPAKAEDALKRLQKPLAVLEGELEGKDYLVENRFTVADLNVASVLAWSALAGADLSAYPRVQGWAGRCSSRPAAAKARG